MPLKKNGTEAYVDERPPCDLHPDREAMYDFATVAGPRPGAWMNGCASCFNAYSHGRRLGVGIGQRLLLK
jgi:hypothetical protein